MRINKYVALATGISRRAADQALQEGRIVVNGRVPEAGQQIDPSDVVTLDNRLITPAVNTTTIMLNKPIGYVVSRDGQGSRTIYELLPPELHKLKAVGRLDKDSSGLLLLTDDGHLTQELTHPKYQKSKQYKIALNKDLEPNDYTLITKRGVLLSDGLSRLDLKQINQQPKEWMVTMHEGRNRQIRRTFDALGYKVVKLHRTTFGPYELSTLTRGTYRLC